MSIDTVSTDTTTHRGSIPAMVATVMMKGTLNMIGLKALSYLATIILSVTGYHLLREWYPFMVYKLFSRGDYDG